MNFLKKLWNAILGKNKKPVALPEVKPIPEPVKIPKVTKGRFNNIAIIIGHGYGDPGAESWDKKRNEFEYNSIVAKYIKENLPDKIVELFFRDKFGITGVNTRVRVWNDDLSIELHCNSASNSNAKGCEILCLGSDKEAIKLGQHLADSFCEKFNRVKRDTDGVKELKKGDRGHYSLTLVDDGQPSILMEPFFINNPNEWIEPLVYAEWLVGELKKL